MQPANFNIRDPNEDRAVDALAFLFNGILSAGIFLIARIFWPPAIAALAALLVLTTAGAAPRRVQSGFARFCDGSGGGRNRERILSIMADAQVGVFGALGLALLLLIHFTIFEALAKLPLAPVWLPANFRDLSPATIPALVPAVVIAQSLSHAFAVALGTTLPWISADHSPKARGRVLSRLVFAWAPAGLTLACGACVDGAFAWAALCPVPLAFLLRELFRRRLGGITTGLSDAARQLTRCVYLLTALALLAEPAL